VNTRALVALLCVLVPASAASQADPVVGNWRGTVTSSAGTGTPIIITITKKGDGYAGTTNGLNAPSEVPLKTIAVDGNRVALEASAESQLGEVKLTCDLTADGAALKGTGTLSVGTQSFDLTLALQRRPREGVIQPRVEQRIEYFAGRWKFDYIGAEYPPLSPGSRTGTMTVSRTGTSNFAAGRVDGDVAGTSYQETMTIGLDPDTDMLVLLERRADGTELVSLGNWRSPIGITFVTSPVAANGKTYQLRRFISITSLVAFEMTEEFSVDGGAFKRLGNARFTKTP